jgi:1-acyl-sn-glycerol-3-phosphate acyltransferase
MNGHGLATIVRLFTGARARWSGCGPEPRQRVYFANHTSNLDFVLLWAALPRDLRSRTRPIAAHDYWTASPHRLFIAEKIFRAVLIERKHVTRANNPLQQMLAALDANDSLIIFPEGGRNPDGVVGEFKSGLFHLAKDRPAVEFVPVWIDNLSRVLPKGEILPLPVLCSVTFGPPLHKETGEDKTTFLQRARTAVTTLGPQDDSP